MNVSTDKKQKIILSAVNLFHRYGYSKTSLEDIAHDANLSKGTIYYYFASKEEIFFEVVKGHSDEFYENLIQEIDKQTSFKNKLTAVIRLPIKLVYEHAPVLLDAIKNIPENELHKLCSFREANRHRMIELLKKVFDYGSSHEEITSDIPVETVVNIIFDWFLLGDSNIMVKNPEEFIKKAESDYEWIVYIILNGVLKRGNNK